LLPLFFPSWPGSWSAFWHELGSLLVQFADHSETMKRCSGRLQDAFGSNIRSWSV